MKNLIIVIYKKRGETPLECLDRLRKEKPEFKDELLSYAGRLDPMAEGALLVLIGDKNKEREKYLNLEKEYVFDVLFGFSADSYDILGKLTDAVTKTTHKRIDVKKILNVVSDWCKKTTQKYPPYSSKTIEGKPLFEWAREGKLNQIEIPKHKIKIFKAGIVGIRTITAEELWNQLDTDIESVNGDFRQKEIRDCWWENLRPLYGEVFDVVTITVQCSSGTYMRSLADELGKMVGIPALAFKIIRTRVGKYTI